jgi:hypothetical protein
MIFCSDSSVIDPLYSWTPTIAVCGIDYYNHPMFPALQNSVLMTTLKNANLYQLKLNASFDSIVNVSMINGINFGRLRDICISPSGRIYLSTSNSNATSQGAAIDRIIEIVDSNYISNIRKIPYDVKLYLYPNPAKDYTIVGVVGDLSKETLRYEIINEEGRVLSRGKLTGKNTDLSLEMLHPGTYQISLINESGQVRTQKLIKQ